jgi:hypothetical protein
MTATPCPAPAGLKVLVRAASMRTDSLDRALAHVERARVELHGEPPGGTADRVDGAAGATS